MRSVFFLETEAHTMPITDFVTNDLPTSVRSAIREALHADPVNMQQISGGKISHTARVEVNGTPYAVKWKDNAPATFFEAEARGLGLLRTAGAFRVPDVIAYGDAMPKSVGYLIMEWIEPAPGVDPSEFASDYGRILAAQHSITAPTFGLDHDNFNGDLRQQNTQNTSWAAFFRDQRIGVQMEIAREKGYLTQQREYILRNLMDMISDILSGATNPPSLLHGDFWSGNFIVGHGGHLAVVDPSAYYGDREIEIAYTEMFGGPPAGFLEAYRRAYPLSMGYEYRRPVLQLYPMLVHMNHFGEDYWSGVEAICRYYGAI
jgi:fructosamine-3-kinase